jgi:hypothetical protein
MLDVLALLEGTPSLIEVACGVCGDPVGAAGQERRTDDERHHPE